MIFGCEVKLSDTHVYKIKKMYSEEEKPYQKLISDTCFVVSVVLIFMICFYGLISMLKAADTYDAKILSVKCEYKNVDDWCIYLVGQKGRLEQLQISEVGTNPKYSIGEDVRIYHKRRNEYEFESNKLREIFIILTIILVSGASIFVIGTITIDAISLYIIRTVVSDIRQI